MGKHLLYIRLVLLRSAVVVMRTGSRQVPACNPTTAQRSIPSHLPSLEAPRPGWMGLIWWGAARPQRGFGAGWALRSAPQPTPLYDFMILRFCCDIKLFPASARVIARHKGAESRTSSSWAWHIHQETPWITAGSISVTSLSVSPCPTAQSRVQWELN